MPPDPFLKTNFPGILWLRVFAVIANNITLQIIPESLLTGTSELDEFQ